MKRTKIKTKEKASYLDRKMSPLMIILFVVLVIYVISLFVPFVWGFFTSFKGKYELRNNVFGLPEKWMVSNYVEAFKAYSKKVEWGAGFRTVSLGEMIVYSVLHSVGCAFIRTLCVCLVAYVTAKFSKYRFSKFINVLVLIVMILPIVGTLPSELALARSLGLYNHIWGLWIMSFNFLGMHYFVFYAMFSGIPKDFSEAAYIDGAGEWSVMLRVMMPMARSMFFIIMLLNFIGYWNDYYTPMLYLPSYPTLAVGLHSLSTSTNNALASVPLKLTGCMMLFLPILILFLVFHNKMIGKVSLGGIKE